MPPAEGQKSPATSSAREHSQAVPTPASATDIVAKTRTGAHLAPPQPVENVTLIAGVRSLSVFELHEPIVSIDDGKGVVQAWAGNGEFFPVFVKPCRSYQLVREVLCNLLAGALGLPVPRAVLLDVSSSPGGRHLLDRHGEGKFAFGVQRRGVDLRQVLRRNRRTEDMLLDWPLLPRAIAFDEWVGNEDRRQPTYCSKAEAATCSSTTSKRCQPPLRQPPRCAMAWRSTPRPKAPQASTKCSRDE